MESHKEGLEIQIRESYGRMVYTYACYHKMADKLKCRMNCIKKIQIGLSAITSSGIVATMLMEEFYINLATAIISAILCSITLYFKEFDVAEEIRKLYTGANDLWLIKEKYISLLTDFDVLTEEQICAQRDALIAATDEIYRVCPKTDNDSYKEAQKALKENEDQYFSVKELDLMLPAHLRKVLK